jgi:hypothetical protein
MYLADLKRKRDIELGGHIREHEEDAIWSWWMVSPNLIGCFSRTRTDILSTNRYPRTPFKQALSRMPPGNGAGSKGSDVHCWILCEQILIIHHLNLQS